MLGELVIGVILGNMALLGIHVFEPIKSDLAVAFLVELGVVILLFQIGLESNIQKMRTVGMRAFMVAVIGVIVPLVLGTYVAGPLLLPGLSFNAYLFLGATLSAPHLGKMFAKIHTGVGMKLTLAISFGLFLAYLAQEIGLAPIVGAFAAGLILDPIHFRYFKNASIVNDIKEGIKDAEPKTKEKILQLIEPHSERHIEELIEPIGHFLVPIFFVVTGLNVRLDVFFNIPILLVALGITAVAFIGKIVSGLAAGRASKMIVGFGMIPRGEVGLIFTVIGRTLGVVSDQVFFVIVIVVILSTLLTPPILTFLLRRQAAA